MMKSPLDIADTGAVALGATGDIAYPLHAAGAVGRVRRFGFRIQLIASIVGAVGAVALTLLGQASLLNILPIALYQCFWVAVTFVATCSELNSEKLHFKK